MRTRRGDLSILVVALLLGLWLGPLGARQSDTPELQLQRGASLAAAGRFLDALPAYRLAAAAPDGRVQFAARLGVVRCSLRTAQFAQARTEASTLLGDHPDDMTVRVLYGDALWSGGLFDSAERAYRDVLAGDADAARAHSGLARSLVSRGRVDEALDHAYAALRLSPTDPDVHQTAGVVLERMGRYGDAAAAYADYAELIPGKDSGDNAVWAKAKIRTLRAFGRRTPYDLAGSPNQVHVIPFRLVDEKIVVRGRINGGLDSDIVIDTGAEVTVLSRATAERRGITPVSYTLSAGVGDSGFRGLMVGLADQVAIGSLRLNNVPCLIKTPAPGPLLQRQGESFSPLAAGLSMSVDYRQRILTVARHLPDETAPDFELPLRLYRLCTVRGVVGKDIETAFVVDTGGQVISISATTADALGLPASTRKIPLKVYGVSGLDTSAFLLPGMQLAFDAIKFDSTPLVVLNLQAPSALLGFELGGTVGHRFLSRYRVSIDLERSVLKLKAL
jgi:tetratricopeptide (TPR) repeat protein